MNDATVVILFCATKSFDINVIHRGPETRITIPFENEFKHVLHYINRLNLVCDTYTEEREVSFYD